SVAPVSPSTIRRWLRQDKIKPWRYHAWQHSTDPHFVEKAAPVGELYEAASRLATRREGACWADEKPSLQARQRGHETQAAIPGHPVQVADRYQRRGALQVFCGLRVASGHTFTRGYARRCFADFQAFLRDLFASALGQGLKVLRLLLDNGPTHAPKPLAAGIASLALAFAVRLY